MSQNYYESIHFPATDEDEECILIDINSVNSVPKYHITLLSIIFFCIQEKDLYNI